MAAKKLYVNGVQMYLSDCLGKTLESFQAKLTKLNVNITYQQSTDIFNAINSKNK